MAQKITPLPAVCHRPFQQSLARNTLLAVAFSVGTWSAFAAPLTCSGDLYLSQGATQGPTTLYVNKTNPVSFVKLGDAVEPYNALGFHPTRGLFGLVTFSTMLLKIGEDGKSTSMLAVDRLPVRTPQNAIANYNAGTFGIDGTYYVKLSNDNNLLYAIDVSKVPAVATPINLSMPINISDMGWVGDRLYSMGDNGQLYSIEVPSGTVTPIGAAKPLPRPRFGSQFSGTNGLFGVDNAGSGFYQFDLLTGAMTKLSDATGSSNNDGASCPTAEVLSIPAPQADLKISKTNNQAQYTPGTDVTYSIVVSNDGRAAAIGAKVEDLLPAGISTASWTCLATEGAGAACTASGVGAIDDKDVNLPVNGSVTYRLRMTVPSTYTGALTNTARVEPPNGVVDPEPGNNVASDTDTSSVAVVNPTSVPALSQWTLGLLTALLAGFAALRMRKH